jgi:mRNA interferase MazF
MKTGRTLKAGDVVLTRIQFVDTLQVKLRPAVVLFEDKDNVVVAGITSNLRMDGVPLTKEDGAIKDSIIKLNYIFTVSSAMISKVLFRLGPEKRSEVAEALIQRISQLKV